MVVRFIYLFPNAHVKYMSVIVKVILIAVLAYVIINYDDVKQQLLEMKDTGMMGCLPGFISNKTGDEPITTVNKPATEVEELEQFLKFELDTQLESKTQTT